MPQNKVTESDLLAALRQKFPEKSYALLSQVRDGTGYGSPGRTADALAMSLWPSRGLELSGFEMKVSRSDWLRELKQPEKAESIARYCDRWWLYVSDDNIVKDGELPTTWGLLVLKGGKLVERVMAPKLSPRELDRVFVASVLRSIQGEYTPNLLVNKRINEASKTQQEVFDTVTGEWKKKCQKYVDMISNFEKKSGLKFSEWSHGDVSEAVGLLMSMMRDSRRGSHDMLSGYRNQINRVVKNMEASVELLRNGLDALNKLTVKDSGEEGPIDNT
jgi:hypothetical protein